MPKPATSPPSARPSSPSPRPAAPPLAKFSRPRLYHVTRRERLFRALDAARAHPIVWIAGAPGAGKSTLVASYVEARKAPGIWFQADAGDADPGTFFHYLRIAAEDVAGRRAKAAAALPRYGAEYAHDLPAFTRRFLREFFALFPEDSMFVVDNFHEAPGDPAWRVAFAEGLREIPAGDTLVFLSRTPPPPEMARLVADQSIVQIDGHALRFQPDEARAMIDGHALDPAAGEAILRASDGWAAGLVLMREHARRTGLDGAAILGDALPEGKEAVFSFFTGEIFNRARPENQRTLLLAALLPSVAAGDAAAIADNPDAPRMLDYLYRHHLFTDRRRAGPDPLYQFHALFREFLLDEGRRRLSADERRSALVRAGDALVGRADFDGAAALYVEAQAWPALAGMALHAAPFLLDEGRPQKLAEWIDALPAGTAAAEPRLPLALGLAVLYSDPPRAKALLAEAFAGFEARGDTRRQLITAAAAVDCHYFEWADFAPLDRWIGVLETLTDPRPEFTAIADALRVWSCFLIALLFRRPDHPRVAECAARVTTLLADPAIEMVPVNARLNAASILFNYSNWKTKGETADALIARVGPWLDEPQATPLNRVWWRFHLAFNRQIRGRYAEAERTMEETEAIAREHGLNSVLFECYHAELTTLISARDAAGAAAALERLRSVLQPSRRMDVAYFRNQEAGVRMLEHRHAEAVAAAIDAVAIGREAGLPPLQLPHFLVRQALARALVPDASGALACYDEAIALADGVDRRNFEFQRRLLGAYFALVEGRRDEAAALLAAILPECRDAAYPGVFRNAPDIAVPLFALALERGIEPDYVRSRIRERRLSAPSPATPGWPWPLAIRTLGAFELARDGEPVVSSGKAQKKPLELLKALVAHGGRNVDAALLTARVWPDAEGDDAKTSFDSNLYRLRKLVAVDQALTLSDGRLSLNPAVVWVDTWAFERVLDAGAAGAAPDIDGALALYRGPFLGLEDAPAWALPLRDRLAARLSRVVLEAGEARERGGDWAGAKALYQRALELDNLAEPIYRRLMIAQVEAGDPAGALVTYRRCRELLSIVLGRPPAAETEALRARLAAPS